MHLCLKLFAVQKDLKINVIKWSKTIQGRYFIRIFWSSFRCV